MGKIFDKKTVQEQQELAQVFGKVAFKTIGDLGLKEDDPKKVALKAVVGGITSQMTGENFASGAASAGFIQIAQSQLANIKDSATLQWVSGIIGAAASKLVGGNAQTGGSIAVSDERNNYLTHKQYWRMLEELNNAKTDEEKAAIKANWEKISQKQDEEWVPNIGQLKSIKYNGSFTIIYEIKDTDDMLFLDGEPYQYMLSVENFKLPKNSFDWRHLWDNSVGFGKDIFSNPLTKHPLLVIGGTIISAGMDIQNSTNPFGLSQGSGKAKISEIEVKFKQNPRHDTLEFERQLKNQEEGMNKLTVDEYLKNRERYLKEGRALEGNAAQKVERENAYLDKVSELRRSGLSIEQAEKQAGDWIKDQAALHNPDQIAGGNPLNIGGMGDKRVNSSIGSQWKYRIDEVDEEIMKQVENMTEEAKKSTYLNVKLTY